MVVARPGRLPVNPLEAVDSERGTSPASPRQGEAQAGTGMRVAECARLGVGRVLIPLFVGGGKISTVLRLSPKLRLMRQPRRRARRRGDRVPRVRRKR